MHLSKRLRGLLFLLICFSFQIAAGDAIQTNPSETEKTSINAKKIINKYLTHAEYRFKTELCYIMTRCGSDKGTNRHNYTSLYSKLFNSYVDKECNIFEMGLGSKNPDIPSNMGPSAVPGASLFGWAIYFPKSQIYGADIDSDILFTTPRIRTYYCDQRSAKSVQEMFEADSLQNVFFDIIIDDGLHEFPANYNFLINGLNKLKKGGFFIIEDLNEYTVAQFKSEIPALKMQYNLSYIEVVKIPNKKTRMTMCFWLFRNNQILPLLLTVRSISPLKRPGLRQAMRSKIG